MNTFILLIHPSVDGHVGCYFFLAIVTSVLHGIADVSSTYSVEVQRSLHPQITRETRMLITRGPLLRGEDKMPRSLGVGLLMTW